MTDNLTSMYEELNGLSDEEKAYALEILKEYSKKGKSDKYTNLLYKEYDEIPVDISTFLHEKKYLGKALIDKEGRFTIFPYWEKVLQDIFPDPLKPAQYNTLALTGSIGLGKSTIAVIIIIYELYRMLCLKDPYVHYGLQPIDLITFAVINITLDAAKGVAWNKLQSMIQASDWFMARGTLSKGEAPEWRPPKGIELIYGSMPRHILGRAVFACLDGDTVINTVNGDFKISDLVDKNINVSNIDSNNDVVISDTCTVLPTKQSCEEIEITLDDDTVIKCTPEHKFLLSDGTYKEAQYLTEYDDICDSNMIGSNDIANH